MTTTTRAPLLRRAAAGLATALLLLPGAACTTEENPPATPPAPTTPGVAPGGTPTVAPVAEEFAELEAEFDARLGVYAIDTESGATLEHRADERFGYASTFKVFAVAAMLADVTAAELAEEIFFTEADLVSHSPITEQHVDTGMTLRALAEAAVRYSDNTAANLILQRLGGPEGFAAALEALGDEVTEPRRYETELNQWAPGQTQDTTSPRAFATNLRAYAVDDALAAEDRELLVEWMRGNTTGDELVRAGVPAGWVVGDRTGAGGTYGTRAVVAVAWPPPGEGAPVVLALMSNRHEAAAEFDNALLARATELVIGALRPDAEPEVTE
ncbi:class A beta-lactamase [Natronosporangium hydrolyticum]|uniref:class A beta-lactamase n=1 Tax=Natronosporangium hydrolyticum TaxID=2811111 RepID=UPI001EFA26DC|nr:class A beta-lactamase [Natronosporangium hydrolyticum]